MAYTLDGTALRAPNTISEANSTQVAQNRTLDGTIRRDFFGSNKRVWTLEYQNVNSTAHNVIKTIYETYLSTGSTVTWVIDETNYTVSSVNVHVDLLQRGFGIKGTDYLSDFTLTLTEA